MDEFAYAFSQLEESACISLEDERTGELVEHAQVIKSGIARILFAAQVSTAFLAS